MGFKEKRALQKLITENLTKLEGEISFKEKRAIQKAITTDFVKLGEKAIPEVLLTPVYDKLKNGDFIDLPADQFIEKLKEAAKELGVEESLTESIIDPANEWKDKREEVANEGVDTNGTANESAEKYELTPELVEELVNEIKESDPPTPEIAWEGFDTEMSFNDDVATEKAKDVDEKLWKYAKKIVLKARFDKEPSGDNEKDNKAITEGEAWGFVQERYQKLESGKIKARKPATESVDENAEIEDDEEILI